MVTFEEIVDPFPPHLILTVNFIVAAICNDIYYSRIAKTRKQLLKGLPSGQKKVRICSLPIEHMTNICGHLQGKDKNTAAVLRLSFFCNSSIQPLVCIC